VGNRRRLAQTKDDAAHRTEHDADFFDPNNAEHTATREHLAMDTLEELLHWLKSYSISELWQKNVVGGSPLP